MWNEDMQKWVKARSQTCGITVEDCILWSIWFYLVFVVTKSLCFKSQIYGFMACLNFCHGTWNGLIATHWQQFNAHQMKKIVRVVTDFYFGKTLGDIDLSLFHDNLLTGELKFTSRQWMEEDFFSLLVVVLSHKTWVTTCLYMWNTVTEKQKITFQSSVTFSFSIPHSSPSLFIYAF